MNHSNIKRGLISSTAVSLLSLSSVFSQDLSLDDLEMRKKAILEEANPSVTVESILADRDEPLGKVVGAFKKQRYYTLSDTIYIQLKSSTVSPGDRFAIYTDEGGVTDPDRALRKLGKKIRVRGFIVVTKVTPDTVIGKIDESFIDIHIGDLIGPPFEVNIEVDPKEPDKMIRGRVLESAVNHEIIGGYEFAYLDKGSADGLALNDKLFVFRTADGSMKIDPHLPEVTIAEMVVVHVAEHFSTAYCLNSAEAFRKGSAFKSAKSEVKYLSEPTPAAAPAEPKVPTEGPPGPSDIAPPPE